MKILFFVTSPPVEDAPNLLEQQRMLQSFKEAFLMRDMVAALMSVLHAPLQDLSEGENYRLLRLVVSTFRNLVIIPGALLAHRHAMLCTQ